MARIVAVDDDPAGQRLMKLILSAAGHEVFTASNGIQGVQMVTQKIPELVILDVMLPGIDGFEVCRRLRAGGSTKNMPIIMLSGKTQASDRETALRMGANEYLVKPVDRQILIRTVTALLENKTESITARGRIFAFIGARGGMGTSTISTNIAVALQKSGKSTLLIDMNPSYSTLGEMIGLNAENSISAIFRDARGTISRDKLESLFVRHQSGLKLLWGETYPDESDVYNPGEVKALVGELRGLADFVVADIPASPTDNSIAVLTSADSVMLVTGANKEALEKLEHSVARLVRFGIEPERIQVITVDRTGNGIDESLITTDSSGGYRIIGIIHHCGIECSKAEAEGTPVVISAPDSSIAEDIDKLMSAIIQQQPDGKRLT